MKKYLKGLQMYSVRNELAKDFEGTVKKVAEMGYDSVEFAGYYGGLSGKELKALLDKYNLVSVSVHNGIDDYLENGQEKMDFFKAYGVKYVTIPFYQVENYKTEEKRKETLEKFNKVAKLVHENGLVLQYHNHDFEFNKLPDGTYYLDWLYNSIPADLLQPQLDTCWVKYGGEDPVKYINKYADRINTIHFKDFYAKKMNCGAVYELIGIDKTEQTKEDNGFEYRPLGKGLQDFDAMLAALEKTDVETIIVEQDESKSPLDDVKISCDYLKSKGL